MEIKRDAYLNKLIRKEHNGLVKVITGVRRAGKSYLLLTIFHQYLLQKGVKENHIIEIAFDDFRYKNLRSPQKLFSYVEAQMSDTGLYYIILDEVQLLEDFVDILNGFLHMDNTDIYVTGSNSKFLSKDVVTEFRGRGDEIHVLPLSFSEFITAYGGNVPGAWQDYITYGGLPLTVSFKSSEEKEAYLSSLFKEVYLTDIIERHNIRHPEEFNELIDILASSVGSLTNPLKISNTFKSVKNKKITDVTISRYIEYLEDAFLINRVARYDIKGRRYIGSPAKFYFEDIGLRNARLNFRQTEETHIMENIIYNELRYRGFMVDVGLVESFEKNELGTTERKLYEIDFVASKGNQKYYIQSAFRFSDPDKITQETNSLRRIPDSFERIIIVGDDRNARMNEDGFLVVGIRQFLLDDQIL